MMMMTTTMVTTTILHLVVSSVIPRWNHKIEDIWNLILMTAMTTAAKFSSMGGPVMDIEHLKHTPGDRSQVSETGTKSEVPVPC